MTIFPRVWVRRRRRPRSPLVGLGGRRRRSAAPSASTVTAALVLSFLGMGGAAALFIYQLRRQESPEVALESVHAARTKKMVVVLRPRARFGMLINKLKGVNKIRGVAGGGVALPVVGAAVTGGEGRRRGRVDEHVD